MKYALHDLNCLPSASWSAVQFWRPKIESREEKSGGGRPVPSLATPHGCHGLHLSEVQLQYLIMNGSNRVVLT